MSHRFKSIDLADLEKHLNIEEPRTDVHTQKATEMFGVPADQVTQGQRAAAKAVNFEGLYGTPKNKRA